MNLLHATLLLLAVSTTVIGCSSEQPCDEHSDCRLTSTDHLSTCESGTCRFVEDSCGSEFVTCICDDGSLGEQNCINGSLTECRCYYDEFDVAEPDVAEPDVAEPDAAEPDVAEPDAAEPDAAEPDAPDQ